LGKNKYDMSWMENKKFKLIIDLFLACVVFILLLGIVNLSISAVQSWFSPKPTPTDLSFMLIPYLGLPFWFWFCVGIGIMGGLTFNGFRIFTYDSDSHNTTNVNRVDKIEK